jgi:hypothetical protein
MQTLTMEMAKGAELLRKAGKPATFVTVKEMFDDVNTIFYSIWEDGVRLIRCGVDSKHSNWSVPLKYCQVVHEDAARCLQAYRDAHHDAEEPRVDQPATKERATTLPERALAAHRAEVQREHEEEVLRATAVAIKAERRFVTLLSSCLGVEGTVDVGWLKTFSGDVPAAEIDGVRISLGGSPHGTKGLHLATARQNEAGDFYDVHGPFHDLASLGALLARDFTTKADDDDPFCNDRA